MSGSKPRAFWEQLIAEFEASGLPHREFVQRKDVKLFTFQSWLYRLRRERESKPPRMLPVRVSAPPVAARPGVLLESAGVTLRFEVGTDVAYLGELLAALGRRGC